MFYLRDKILLAKRTNGFTYILIYGQQGVGKSSYAIKLVASVLGSYDEALKRIFYHPKKFLEWLENLKQREIAIVDDAGVFLSKYWFFADRNYVSYITGLMHVVRTKLYTIIVTTPDPLALLKVFRSIDAYYVKIVFNNSKVERVMLIGSTLIKR